VLGEEGSLLPVGGGSTEFLMLFRDRLPRTLERRNPTAAITSATPPRTLPTITAT